MARDEQRRTWPKASDREPVDRGWALFTRKQMFLATSLLADDVDVAQAIGESERVGAKGRATGKSGWRRVERELDIDHRSLQPVLPLRTQSRVGGLMRRKDMISQAGYVVWREAEEGREWFVCRRAKAQPSID